MRRRSDGAVLLIRTRARRFELPKGHLEPGEDHAQAAARELCEETALCEAPAAGPLLGELHYRFDGSPSVDKTVRVYLFDAVDEPRFGALPRGTRERRWVSREALADLPLASENLRPLLLASFDQPG